MVVFSAQIVLCTLTLVIALMLLPLITYHLSLIATNSTTQEQERDKYDLWGSNVYNYGTCTSLNCLYFFIQQDSLIFGDHDSLKNINNQHIKDSKLIHSIEVSEEDPSQSKYSYSHVGEALDNKSMRSIQSYKSKKSIKSEALNLRTVEGAVSR